MNFPISAISLVSLFFVAAIAFAQTQFDWTAIQPPKSGNVVVLHAQGFSAESSPALFDACLAGAITFLPGQPVTTSHRIEGSTGNPSCDEMYVTRTCTVKSDEFVDFFRHDLHKDLRMATSCPKRL
jgi:hypothetical protein